MDARILVGGVLASLVTSSCLGPNPIFDGPVLGGATEGDASTIATGSDDVTSAADAAGGPSTSGGTTADADEQTGGTGGPAATSGGATSGGAAWMNLVATANGGVLERYSSEYCDPMNLPSNCEDGRWNHTNINDGQHAVGYNDTAFLASWASNDKASGTDPETFEFTFAGDSSAHVETIVVQNYGEEGGAGPYYTTHIIVSGRPPGGGPWFPILDVDISANETPQSFDLVALNGSAAHVEALLLEITASVHPQYWELGEFEAWGTPD